ncbi:hypothetical protein SESBI_27099 [Sesbania bispinosa]|nr:hypothetical protein SESBI_27099 [Sesbania bispinosa]
MHVEANSSMAIIPGNAQRYLKFRQNLYQQHPILHLGHMYNLSLNTKNAQASNKHNTINAQASNGENTVNAQATNVEKVKGSYWQLKERQASHKNKSNTTTQQAIAPSTHADTTESVQKDAPPTRAATAEFVKKNAHPTEASGSDTSNRIQQIQVLKNAHDTTMFMMTMVCVQYHFQCYDKPINEILIYFSLLNILYDEAKNMCGPGIGATCDGGGTQQSEVTHTQTPEGPQGGVEHKSSN